VPSRKSARTSGRIWRAVGRGVDRAFRFVTFRSPNPSYGRRRYVGLALRYLVMTVFAIVIVFPIYIIFLDAMLSVQQITSTPPVLFSWHLHWGVFLTAWRTADLGRGLYNSTITSVAIVLGELITSVLAAFAFAFLNFPWKRTLFILTLTTLMIPFEVTVITNLQTVSSLHLYGNLGGLIVPFLATGFGIFLLRQAFTQIPPEMHEAAVMDGYSHLRFMRRVAVPMARPTIAALAVFTFLSAWNSYLWPDIITSNNPAIRTLQIQIKELGGTPTTANLQIAAAAIVVFPLLIILIFFQKQLIRSLSAGAVK
jgi:sn-glycerol 3-phosphate transport system permease protein